MNNEINLVFNTIRKDYDKFTLLEFVDQINLVFDFTKQLAYQYTRDKHENKLGPMQFHFLWGDYLEGFMLWSGMFNRAIRINIEKERDHNLLAFQKYCLIYQYWWALFHLLTRHFTNFNRELALTGEKKFLTRVEKINQLLNSDEVIDEFLPSDLEHILNAKR